MERDEYLLFNQPLHSMPQYVRAHQLAGDLELAPDPWQCRACSKWHTDSRRVCDQCGVKK